MAKVKRPIDRRAALSFAAAIAGGMTGSPAAAQPQPQLEKKGARGRGSDALLYRQIEEVMEETAKIWNSQKYGNLREVWDTDDKEPWYVPEEIAEPFFTWEELDKYWNRGGDQGLRAFRWQFSNLRVKDIGTGLALAIFDHFYEYQLPFPGAVPSAGKDRCLAIFRRVKGKWRHILYAQCPQGPEAYVRMMREKMVTPDFGTFRDNVDKKPKPKS
ncbi:MAG: hypothetical protein EXR11_10530 [Rhodospirillaceae bacterium]|nr:hypothetical protein [Rhodospirillaceae bacterium]